MVKVADLGRWYLVQDDKTNPWFVNQDGLVLHPFELAQRDDGRAVYREVKRKLDIADLEWRNPGNYPPWMALDKAKIGLETALQLAGRWSDDLKEDLDG